MFKLFPRYSTIRELSEHHSNRKVGSDSFYFTQNQMISAICLFRWSLCSTEKSRSQREKLLSITSFCYSIKAESVNLPVRLFCISSVLFQTCTQQFYLWSLTSGRLAFQPSKPSAFICAPLTLPEKANTNLEVQNKCKK